MNGEGHRVRNPYVSVYEFEGDEIRRWRDDVDQATLQAIEGGAPLSEWILPLVSEERGRASEGGRS